jgi:hypothetical protein
MSKAINLSFNKKEAATMMLILEDLENILHEEGLEFEDPKYVLVHKMIRKIHKNNSEL